MPLDLSILPGRLASACRSVECAVADFSSVARGKVVARADFEAQGGCRLPSVVLGVTLTGGEPEAVFGPLLPTDYRDVHLLPDLATAVPVPGRSDRLSVICEPAGELPRLGREPLDASHLSPRAALGRVLTRLAEAGLRATVAPELEFFLLERTPQGGLRPAGVPGGSGAREHALEIASLERASHFAAYFDALFEACALQRIPVTGFGHESATGQYEVNFAPGDPLAQADAVWRFKRLARQTAVQQGFLASFIAKPFPEQPGTGLHWHASLQHLGGPRDGANAFADEAGEDTPRLAHFIGGLQAHAPASLALLAPWAHSFERLRRADASPTDASWGEDDRGVAFRLPAASAANRRIEHRLPGGDASPYLTLAVLLGSGLLGMEAGLPRLDPAQQLPTDLPQALTALEGSSDLRGLLGEPLVALYVAQKRHELQERAALADPRRDWDLRHLVELA
ncbi:MAG: glutamine synthetase [Leptothrix sp. (in: Bacteria)]|jgi:glutamine synthetase|nr:glutamine synthetase [Leptothrix sp. (in: b-proteobacteria)]